MNWSEAIKQWIIVSAGMIGGWYLTIPEPLSAELILLILVSMFICACLENYNGKNKRK